MPSTSFEQFASAVALKTYLIEQAVSQYADLFGRDSAEVYYNYPIDDFIDIPVVMPVEAGEPVAVPDAAPSPPPSPDADSGSDAVGDNPRDFSETNTQVEGVDEADLVETDSEFIYQVNGQLLTVVDARDARQLAIAAQFSLAPFFDADPLLPPDQSVSDLRIGIPITDSWSEINGMYLQGDRLTVIASGYAPTDYFSTDVTLTDALYGYYDGTPTVQVTVFDITDPTNLNLVETSTLEGWLVTSRAIGNEVFVVTNNNFSLPAPIIKANGFYETQAEYRDRIHSIALDLALPNVATVDGTGQSITNGLLTDVTDIYSPLDPDPWQLTTISTFDVGNERLGVDAATGIPTDWVREVFVSANALYLLKEDYEAETLTEIVKVDLDTGDWVAQGQVPGAIDNQFSVDEHGGFLRITTTSGFWNDTSNNVYILEQQDADLNIVGRLENIAPGEQIFSTRFRGDYGFMVTFEQVDPLFTLDLSDPRNPRLIGELKVPGFSEYLQVIEQDGRTLLLGVGQDADPETGIAGALKISLFDVTDLANPQEIDSYIFAGDFTSSEALWNHRAITYSPRHNLLAIPVETYDFTTFSYTTTLQVFQVDGNGGLTNLGQLVHDDAWINRSLYIDDILFAVSGQQISAHLIPTLEDLSDITWSGQGIGLTLTSPAADTQLQGGERDDRLIGNLGQDVLSGGLGVDQLWGGDGPDRLQGDGENDRLYGDRGHDRLRGDAGNDLLVGGEGGDRLTGGKGNDQLVGGAGRDYLHGGKGADVISGGGKGDRFIFRKPIDSPMANYDHIIDLAIGRDEINSRWAIAADELLQLGSIEDFTRSSIRAVLTHAQFTSRGAATFTIGEQTFLALNDPRAGFQANRDAVINITGFTGSLEELSIG
ncbi:MAG: beta-propeller domain-containing protein [Leptolyngbyaceae bacterium]|nr:beta-propeller domain-containing protein [Leptolyngbyaceae bacterium]